MTPIRRRVLTVAAAVLALANLGPLAAPAGAAECSANPAYQLICTIKDGPVVCVTEPCP